MMLVRPTPPRTAYRLVCERHTRSDYCINDAIAHSHVADWTECQLEEYNLIPLDELLDELGVMR